ncbi:methionyl-tRNA formyltransferase [Paracoccus denitrificans]|jgi:methionyl-tRNA formyltransferase|uniref:Methionyl-tRNA formyltransferase n=1 Tax=Paracoccus denitrificans (strain Pd 1222) TaxID=318586 RepID=FMT_PARDP|nr:methionyl-tRNA formyltransferase [Paracoccus denitrificans]A1AZR0.1 RecName: Full=Methionyl-tRNA formyltransferase [Paracoccus denitrificans PD1222]ABL68754.1 methionyl-tRNA formyltransferase [Paracoccus denitrificans PD1222]MBB4625520.1 methionyl-tRNA formyltransferase [Paracoccus denitrificans]MCU7427311.1 methionyl-tRNA formyltransferase [Paracoccus denitrificans]QAR26808.1 methionyl-tRNA formyltransferase [Paracoccus denitrificans]UPV95760.1 methionyl-tRNA formyltransferase [Paracoccus
MRVIFMGTPDFSVPALRAIAARHQVVAVYSQPPRAAGRGQKPRPSPVHRAAEELGLPVRTPERLKSPQDQGDFAALQADVAVVVAYGLILPQPVLEAPWLGCLNIHASLLPRWRGAAPIHRAIMAGDAETGVAIMQMEAGLDTGPVLAEARTTIGAEDTTADLHDRLAEMGAALIVETLHRLPLPAEPQPAEGVTYAQKIDKAEARIDWGRPAAQVDRQIRGLSPFPGAWCLIGGERVKLLRSRLAAGSGAPGRVLSGFTIACGEGAVEVLEAQREGKRPMPAAEILRGMALPDRLD